MCLGWRPLAALAFLLLTWFDHAWGLAGKPIKKVAIIGGGIAGLSLAHSLVNSESIPGGSDPIEVSVFDSRKALNFEAGAGIQISGGMSVLRKMNPKLQRAVADAAIPLTGIRSRTKPWIPSNKPFATLLEIDLLDAIQNADPTTRDSLIVDGEMMTYTIMRGALQKTLLDQLPSTTAKRVRFGKTMVGIRGSSNEGIMVDFQDGTSEGPFDFVAGCDGIKTAVKEFIETGKVSENPVDRKGSTGIYSGIRIRYAVQDLKEKRVDGETAELRQYFGSGGYALAGLYGTGRDRPLSKCAFTIFLDKDYIGPFKKKEASSSSPVKENVGWTQDNRSGTREEMLRQLDDFAIPDVDLGPIISEASRFFELGVYFHIPFSLNGWSKAVPNSGGSYCTLCGDAAHAMPPFLGQGANQAIQDAYCLAQKVFEHNARSSGETTEPFGKLLRSYEKIRWRPTTDISAKAAFLGYVEAGQGPVSKFRDVLFFTLGKVGVARKVFLDAATPKTEE